MEQICNYIDMSPEQREAALSALSSIGFCPAYGKEKTMQRIMDKSTVGEMPQFYFVFRNTELIGYMFLIGDTKRFRAFPWMAVDNLDELPMRVAEPLIKLAAEAWHNEGKDWLATQYNLRLDNYKRGIGRRKESDCR